MLRLVISNHRGGVSKTTTTATLARFFGDQRLRVLAIDTHPHGSLGLILGLHPQRYLYDSVIRNCALADCVVPAKPDIDVLCSNRDTTKVEAALLGTVGRELAFSRMLGSADHAYDVVLVDVSPSISLVQPCALLYAKNLLVPVAMDMLSLQGAVACFQTASMLADVFQTAIRPVALLPVMLDRRFSLTAYILQALEEVSKRYSVPHVHAVRTDGTVSRAERAKMFLADYDPKCKALEDYNSAAGQLMEMLNVKERPPGNYQKAVCARVHIEPICVDELLTAAGMSGFLGVLEPCAPARDLGPFLSTDRSTATQSANLAGMDAGTVLRRFAVQVEGLVGRLARQQKLLSEIWEVTRRIEASAERLRRGADLICVGVAAQRVRTLAKERIHMGKTKMAVQSGASPKEDWKDWIHTNGPTDTPAADGPVENSEADPLHELIARLAYAAWEARGCQGGSAEEDWLRAEAEVRGNIAARIGQS
jgi:chromosome partitioning protein